MSAHTDTRRRLIRLMANAVKGQSNGDAEALTEAALTVAATAFAGGNNIPLAKVRDLAEAAAEAMEAWGKEYAERN